MVIATTTASVCTASNNAVTIIATGTCTITANASATAIYNAASQKTLSFTVAAARAVQIYYVHTDQIDTPRQITAASDNAVVWRWDNQDAFGDNLPVEKPSGSGQAFKYHLRFAGQIYDQETATSYNYFRDYDAKVGRYAQSDPIGLEGGINTYGYVGGNPLSMVDPYGLFGWADLPTAPQWAEEFGAGLGDVLTFGISGAIRDQFDIGNVDRCSRAYIAGEVAGVVASVATGFAGGTKAVAKASSPNNWANFSHSGTPASWNRGSPWSKTGNRANGDYIPTTGKRPDLHDLMDATAAGVGGKYPTWPAWRRAPNRMPYTPGAALYGGASAAMNSCGCKK